MRTVTIQIPENIYPEVLLMLSSFPGAEVTEEEPSFFVSSMEEARKRVKEAIESDEEPLTEEQFWQEMDEHIAKL